MSEQQQQTETTQTTPTDQTTQVEQKAGQTLTEAADSKSSSTDKPESLLNEKKPEDAKPQVPDKYEFKLPKDFVINEEQTKEVSQLFKDTGLSQDAAQKLMDYYVKQSQAASQQLQAVYDKQRQDWQAAVKADPEIGPNLETVKVDVSRMLDSIGDTKLTKDFREAMDHTGAGDNPAFVKMFAKLAKRFSEGKPVTGNVPNTVQNGGKPASAAQALYPNLPA